MTQVANRRSDPFLSGDYAPVADEFSNEEVAVIGEIPKGLNGTFLRTGPNAQFEPLGRYHVFDGDGMLHAFTIEDGKATYSNKWIVSAALESERRAGHALFGGMANFVIPSPEERGDAGIIKNTGNTNVVHHAGRTFALMEACPPTLIGPDLTTLGEFDFDGRLKGPFTAHPKLDPETGEMLFFGYSPIPPYLRYHAVDAGGTLTRTVDIELPEPVMIHDFVTTRDHVIFFDSPAVFSIKSLMAGGPMVSWKPENGTRIGVMARNGTEVEWFETDNCYIFHFVNGWSEGNKIFVDACRSPIMELDLNSDESSDTYGIGATLARFTIDLDSKRVTWEQLDDRSGDFPRIADSHVGLKNRYGYLAGFREQRGHLFDFDRVIKYDLETGTANEYKSDGVVGEPIFAADPNGKSEDDGWVVTHSRANGVSEMLVLDAHDLSAGPVARLVAPQRIPYGFHGAWIERAV